MTINNHTVRNSDPVPTHFADVPANWHDIAGQRFRVDGRHVHIGGNHVSGYARVVRSLCAVTSGGVTIVPVVSLDADALAVLAHYGILVEEVEPGCYRAVSSLRFESHYRIAQGGVTLAARYS